jgi:hypothetical protein
VAVGDEAHSNGTSGDGAAALAELTASNAELTAKP